MRYVSRAAVVFILFIVACQNKDATPTTAPSNLTVTPGEGLVVLTWDVEPHRKYWVFYEPGTGVNTTDPNASVISGITSPYVLNGLTNGTQYAFAMNATHGSSKGGPSTSVTTATPRLLSPSVPWIVGTPFTANTLRGIAFGDNIYVAIGDTGAVYRAPYSYANPGGVTAWSPGTQLTNAPIGLTVDLTSVIYDGVRFVILGADGSITGHQVGQDWTVGFPIQNAPKMNAITYGGSVYVAVGDQGTIEINDTSGITGAWSIEPSPTSEDLYGVSYENGIFVAVGAGGTLLTSPDGITWTLRPTGTTANLRHVAYGSTTYVAVGDGGTIVSSADTITWTLQTSNNMPTQNLYSIRFGPDNQFIIVGAGGILAYSLTGTDGSWAISSAGTADLFSLAAAPVFIAVGNAGANVSGK